MSHLFVRLTLPDNSPKSFNPDHIQALSPNANGGAVVMVGNKEISVKEDYQRVLKVIADAGFREVFGN